MTRKTPKTRKTHPDTRLDERLVQSALELLAEEGIEGLTLRRVARRAGVSHGAPARHFRSLKDLLAEVAARGFALLSEAIEKSGAQMPAEAGPMPRLAAAARAYLDCAVENAALFALMFRTEALDQTNAALAREGPAAFDQLLRQVRAAQAQGWHSDLDPYLLAGSLWASVHGLATLWSQGAFQGPVPHASLHDALAITLELVDDRRGEPR
jgi:AcrR family transcriptional regulator